MQHGTRHPRGTLGPAGRRQACTKHTNAAPVGLGEEMLRSAHLLCLVLWL